MSSKNTICHYATSNAQAGVGIIRISGDKTNNIANKILGFMPRPRYAHFANFLDSDNSIIDEGIAIFYPKPNSFTGEDVFEIQCHGGRYVMDIIFNQLLQYGANIAQAGEFSKRAFLNGKIDLVQAEAIADLISANSNKAAKSAVSSLKGHFSKNINDIVAKVKELRVFVESTIDFSDEELDFIPTELVLNKTKEIKKNIEDILRKATQGRVLQEGINITIIGKPNAGKSSLLNALTKEETAIVTAIEGTTRDVLKEKIIIDGIPCNIIDTAGIRDSNNIIEQEGIKRAKNAIKSADIVLLVYDGREKPNLKIVKDLKVDNMILIKNKADLINNNKTTENEVLISAKNNTGIDNLIIKIKQLTKIPQLEEDVLLARKRHIVELKKALETVNITIGQTNIELLAEDLRITQEHLNKITGRFTSDDLLGEIFTSFCIGK